MKKPIGVHIEGTVYTNDGKALGNDQFLNAFIEFIESKGWHFGGGSIQVDADGEKIENVD